ncbi:FG-GAP-like repeat-containing protein [Conexibacter sp. CPCC 206217]|uniref:FG-GAP-like repeat-containing protein n=1 Tax=Conexibacter sp. CPCC 206217 TaxID=3064574 RepID=UPI00271BB0C3|nr:FG-GAP-like repeat-containing protein [Conexibacter sp. CPCC 206217]MDO8211967.1 FG-GAP-like repeat-containing protein [Conexibacter sp. CPCC 206217]
MDTDQMPGRARTRRRAAAIAATAAASLALATAPAWAGPSAVSYRALSPAIGNGVGTPVAVTTGKLDATSGRDDAVALTRSGGNTTRLLAYASTVSGALSLAGTSVSVGTDPTSLAVADFDGDGDLDAAVGTSDGHVIRWTGSGSGAFTIAASTPIPPAVGGSANSSVTDLAVANLNGDGIPDLVATYSRNVALGSDGYAALVTGSGSTWTVGTRNAFLSNPVAVAAGDMDGDGIDDLVAADDGLVTDGVTVVLGDGSGGLAPPTDYDVSPLQGPTDVSVGDLDADGALDVAVTTTGLAGLVDTVTSRLGRGDGTLLGREVQYQVGQDPQWVSATSDLTGDGFADVLVLDQSTVELSAALSDGFGGFRTPADFDVAGVVPLTGAAGDFDGDGWTDAVALMTNGDLSVLLHRTPGIATTSAVTFADQPATTSSAPSAVTVTNAGTDADAPLLRVSGTALSGAGAGDFSTEKGTCAGAALAIGQSCALQVRFVPSVAGARSATLSVTSNGPRATTTVALSGLGTAIPSGPQGPQGPQGAPGGIGPQGSPGTTGADGARGPQGQPGAGGATGPVGPRGADGADGVTTSTPCPQVRIRGIYHLRCQIRFAAPKGAPRWVRVRIFQGNAQVGQRLAKMTSGRSIAVPVGKRKLKRGKHKIYVVVRNPATNLAVTYVNFVTVR